MSVENDERPMPLSLSSLSRTPLSRLFLSLSYHEILSADALDGPAGISVKKRRKMVESSVSGSVFFRVSTFSMPRCSVRRLLFLFLSLSLFTHSILARGAARAAAPSPSSSVALRGGMGGDEKGLEKKRKQEEALSFDRWFRSDV